MKRSPNGAPMAWINAHANEADGACLVWPYSRTSAGYGNLATPNGNRLAHRLMCELVNGQPPTDQSQAAHSCGNGKHGCCHPRHLRWADQSGNEADKLTHGTSNRGARNGRATMTEAVVLDIVSQRKGGRMLKEISADLGVPIATICSITKGHNWGWLTGIVDSRLPANDNTPAKEIAA